MLYLVTGPAGSGKTSYLYDQALRLAQVHERVLFVVPEQATFIAERRLYAQLGSLAERVEVLSFTRLANRIFEELGGPGQSFLSDAGRFVLMSAALESLGDLMAVYGRHTASAAFIAKAVEAVEEMKNAGLTPQALSGFAFSLEEGTLRQKLGELSLIYDVYDAMVRRRFADPLDALSRAAEKTRDSAFFRDRSVLVDAFDGFTAPEYAMIRRMAEDCPELYLSLTMGEGDDPQGLWENSRQTARRLTRIGREAAGVAPGRIRLEETRRFKSPALKHLEAHILRPEKRWPYEKPEDVRLFTAPDPFEEMTWAAAEICRLVREEGFRYRDILVVTRSWERYLPLVSPVLERFGIPYFWDAGEDIHIKPLISMTLLAAQIASGGFRTADMLRLARSVALDMTAEERGLLENYCYIWQIEGTDWERDWKNHPDGLQAEFSEKDRIKLEAVNGSRLRLVAPLTVLRKAVVGGSAADFAAGLYRYLETVQAGANLIRFAQGLPQPEQKIFLDEQSQLWDALMDILDLFAIRVEGGAHDPKRLSELLKLAVEAVHIARPPETLDQVLVGQADRVRPDNPRAAFVIGAVESEFPKTDTAGGLLSAADRRRLAAGGAQMIWDADHLLARERLFGYNALTAASRRVYISYPQHSAAGEALLPSVLFTQAKAMFPDARLCGEHSDDTVVNLPTAADALSGCWHDNTPRRASLETLLRQNGGGALVERIRSAAQKPVHQIQDKAVSLAVFGRDMRLSPSRIERYYSCPFSFLMSGPMGIRARRKAEPSALEAGSLIHWILEHMLTSGVDLLKMERAELRGQIRASIESYVSARAVDGAVLGKRSAYLFDRLAEPIEALLLRIAEELAQSLFIPTYFEMPVQTGSRVEPVKLVTPEGLSVRAEGIIDRVDIARLEQGGYVRVVDYKSGRKSFSLGDVGHGLNMQMLIYLFSVCQNGREDLAGLKPAGILYMPSLGGYVQSGRDVSPEELERRRREQYRMRGLVLEDPDVIRAMEAQGKGAFIPAKLTAKETVEARSAVISALDLERLRLLVEKKIADMASLLAEGRVEACPVQGGPYRPCEYCDYRGVCGFEEGDPVRPVGDEAGTREQDADLIRGSGEDGQA